jgi:hypothetical protein
VNLIKNGGAHVQKSRLLRGDHDVKGFRGGDQDLRFSSALKVIALPMSDADNQSEQLERTL